MAETRLTRRRPAQPTPVADWFGVLTAIGTRPRVWVRDRVLDTDECDRLLAAAADPAQLGVARVRHDTTGTSFEWPVAAHPLTVELDRRITELIGERSSVGDTLRFRAYAPGEAHPPHLDNYRIGAADLVVTAMVCLTDCDDGGTTTFDRGSPPVSVPPAQGRLVIWSNCLHNGAPDVLAHHSGDEIRAGRKVTLTAFVYRPPTTSSFVRRGPVGVGR